MSFIPMTKMPERIALSHCFGGLAAALVGIAEFHHRLGAGHLDRITAGALGLEVYFGLITFTGSLMAFGKLQGFITGAPVTYPGQNFTNVWHVLRRRSRRWSGSIVDPSQFNVFLAIGGVGLLLGVLFVLPIGGADMPVVISLLNSYAGLAASATGFALSNNVLIIAGALDGTSGFFLSIMMSKAMNRSFSNVLFGAFGTGRRRAPAAAAGARARPTRTSTRPASKRPPSCSRPRSRSSWCPATAWPSRRRSTRCASSPRPSRPTAQRSATRSTRSQAACPAT